MNAHAQSSAVAGSTSNRRQSAPKKPRKTRSKFGYLFDLTDENDRRMCNCMSIYHLGNANQPVRLKRTYRAVGDKSHRAIFEVVRMPRRQVGQRWRVIGWDIDGREVVFMDVPTKRLALAMLREFPAR